MEKRNYYHQILIFFKTLLKTSTSVFSCSWSCVINCVNNVQKHDLRQLFGICFLVGILWICDLFAAIKEVCHISSGFRAFELSEIM